jgi:hypothetical protein
MKNLYFQPFLILLCIAVFQNIEGQKIVKINQAKGEYILPAKSDISDKTAFERAVNEAKLDALRKAGVAENISSSDVLSTSQKGNDFKQDLNSILTVEVSGAVLNDSVVYEKRTIDQFGNTVYHVEIIADVIVYEKKADPSFDFAIKGVREYYENDELMTFSFLPYADGYLKIFNINDKEVSIIYPFFYEKGSSLNDIPNRLFKANENVLFPINKLIGNPDTRQEGYMVSTELPRESNYLVFVYTKENVSYVDKLNFKSVVSWIYRISPDKRKVQFLSFVIVNRSK